MKNTEDVLSKYDGAYNPLVSIIMNCFNGEKYLREAVDSVLSQTYTNIEIIFWDNQSSDDSAKIMKEFDDERIRYFLADSHTMLYEARRLAIEKASGEFLAFLDVDDIWIKEKLEMQLPLFKDPDVGFVCSNFLVRYQDRKKYNTTIGVKGERRGGFVLPQLLEYYFVGLLTLTIRKKSYDQLDSKFDGRFNYLGDFDLVIRLSKYWKMGWLDSPLAVYRWHSSNLSHSSRFTYVNELEIWINEYIAKNNIEKIPEFNIFMQKFYRHKLIAFKLNGKWLNAFKLIRLISSFKVKTIFIFLVLLPIDLVEWMLKLKNRISTYYEIRSYSRFCR